MKISIFTEEFYTTFFLKIFTTFYIHLLHGDWFIRRCLYSLVDGEAQERQNSSMERMNYALKND